MRCMGLACVVFASACQGLDPDGLASANGKFSADDHRVDEVPLGGSVEFAWSTEHDTTSGIADGIEFHTSTSLSDEPDPDSVDPIENLIAKNVVIGVGSTMVGSEWLPAERPTGADPCRWDGNGQPEIKAPTTYDNGESLDLYTFGTVRLPSPVPPILYANMWIGTKMQNQSIQRYMQNHTIEFRDLDQLYSANDLIWLCVRIDNHATVNLNASTGTERLLAGANSPQVQGRHELRVRDLWEILP